MYSTGYTAPGQVPPGVSTFWFSTTPQMLKAESDYLGAVPVYIRTSVRWWNLKSIQTEVGVPKYQSMESGLAMCNNQSSVLPTPCPDYLGCKEM